MIELLHNRYTNYLLKLELYEIFIKRPLKMLIQKLIKQKLKDNKKIKKMFVPLYRLFIGFNTQF